MTDVDRTKLTFEQAEGLEPLPSQLKPKELTQHLRAAIWFVLHYDVFRTAPDAAIQEPWSDIFFGMHVFRFGLPADEFDPRPKRMIEWTKSILLHGSYDQVFGFLQWILRHEQCPRGFTEAIELALTTNKAGYRLIDGKTFMPIASEEEAEVAKQAFAALNSSEYAGARTHLATAAELLSTGHAAGSMREGMQAVEAVARIITKQKTFADALKVLEQQWKIHAALKAAFSRLYGYTSDEQGIRHPLLDDANAPVDETDALFMFGACAAFVTYLIQKSNAR